MEHIYNFLLSTRNCTTLRGSRDHPPAEKGSTMHRDSLGSQSAPIGASHASHRGSGSALAPPALPDVEPGAHGGKRPSSARRKSKIIPEVHFHASSEILYRTLLGELHEDIHHDQTAMLVAFIYA